MLIDYVIRVVLFPLIAALVSCAKVALWMWRTGTAHKCCGYNLPDTRKASLSVSIAFGVGFVVFFAVVALQFAIWHLAHTIWLGKADEM